MNIFGEGFPQEIVDQVAVRQKVYGSGFTDGVSRTPEDIIYLNSRTAWCKLSSAVFIENINEGSFIFNYGEKPGNSLLLISKFYEPKLIDELKDKIGIISKNHEKYNDLDNNIYYFINQLNNWENIIDSIYSCKYIISSSIIGLICADSYNKSNIWLDEDKDETDFKDYFINQNREYINIKNVSEFDEKLLYTDGNKINLDDLINDFPFKKYKILII